MPLPLLALVPLAGAAVGLGVGKLAEHRGERLLEQAEERVALARTMASEAEGLYDDMRLEAKRQVEALAAYIAGHLPRREMAAGDLGTAPEHVRRALDHLLEAKIWQKGQARFSWQSSAQRDGFQRGVMLSGSRQARNGHPYFAALLEGAATARKGVEHHTACQNHLAAAEALLKETHMDCKNFVQTSYASLEEVCAEVSAIKDEFDRTYDNASRGGTLYWSSVVAYLRSHVAERFGA